MIERWKMSKRLTVEYMAWPKFVQGVDDIVQGSALPNMFSGYDLIWGGADLNLNIW